MKISISILIAGLLIFYIGTKVYDFRSQEARLIYGLHQIGSGFDDGAQEIMLENDDRYRDLILSYLQSSEPGSTREKIAMTFFDVYSGDSEFDLAIKHLAQSHPVESTRCFWHDVVHERFKWVELNASDDSSLVASQLVDRGSTCGQPLTGLGTKAQ